jgi:hypothetical protein
MDTVDVQLAFLIWMLLLLGAWLVAALQLGTLPGTRSLVVSWAALSAATLFCGYLVAFAACHALLFLFGREIAAVGFLGSTFLLAATPFAWAKFLRRTHGHPTAHR